MVDNREDPSSFTVKKKVDETWKDSVEKEKGGAGSAAPQGPAKPDAAAKTSHGNKPEEEASADFEPSFSSLITSLGVQAFMALGEFPGSADAEQVPPVNLVQAKSLIDILEILSEKTKGNLTKEEAAMLQEMLVGLKMKFVEKSGKF